MRVDRVRRPLEAPYSGPFLVVKRGEKYFVIKDNMGKEQAISVDRLKPVHQTFSEEQTTVSESSSDASASTSSALDAVDASSDTSAQNLYDSSHSDTKLDYVSRSGRRVSFKRDSDYFYY